MNEKKDKKNIFIDSSFPFSPNNSSFTGDAIFYQNRTSSIENLQYENQPNIFEIEKNINKI